jgi:tetratricopeptide (TPR) repeat protein
MKIQNTVFISYRRTNIWTARAVYQSLASRGYDVFLDFESIGAGSFERVILSQISARAHFLVVLTPSALERCVNPNDWLLREIECALELKRNIVPLMFEDFSFNDVKKYLSGRLSILSQYNGLEIPSHFFNEAIDRLCSQFLETPLELILHPTPLDNEAEVSQPKQDQVAVTEAQLKADGDFERAWQHFKKGNFYSAISGFDEVIELNPQHYEAYLNRGTARLLILEYDGAISDFNKTIQLNPKHAVAYANRGSAYEEKGSPDRAIADYSYAIQLDPQFDGAIT